MTTVVKTQIRGAQTTIVPADDLRDYRRRAIMTPGERAAQQRKSNLGNALRLSRKKGVTLPAFAFMRDNP